MKRQAAEFATPTCPQGHTLNAAKSAMERLCDLCDEDILGSHMECKACEFDLCMRCFKRRHTAKKVMQECEKIRWFPKEINGQRVCQAAGRKRSSGCRL